MIDTKRFWIVDHDADPTPMTREGTRSLQERYYALKRLASTNPIHRDDMPKVRNASTYRYEKNALQVCNKKPQGPHINI